MPLARNINDTDPDAVVPLEDGMMFPCRQLITDRVKLATVEEVSICLLMLFHITKSHALCSSHISFAELALNSLGPFLPEARPLSPAARTRATVQVFPVKTTSVNLSLLDKTLI